MLARTRLAVVVVHAAVALVASCVAPRAANALPPPDPGGGGGLHCNPSVTLDLRAGNLDLGVNWPGATYVINGGSPRLRQVSSDCDTTFHPVPRVFRLVTKPAQSNAALVSGPVEATLTTDRLGEYVVTVELCPNGCKVGSTTVPARTMTYKAVASFIRNVPPATRPVVAAQPQTSPTSFCHADTCAASPFRGEQNVDVKCQGGGDLAPQWVTVEPFAGPHDYRLVEGRVDSSGIAGRDLWLNHVSKDMNVTLTADPQFAFLSSHTDDATIEVEWERSSIPERFRPSPGDRMSVWGYHIHDCGHSPYHTEIHPPVGAAVHRARPIRLPENATFDFPGGRDKVGANVWVPGVVTDIWFNREAGGVLGDSSLALHQPARRIVGLPHPGIAAVNGPAIHGPASLDKIFSFNIYLPPSPAKLYGDLAPVPLFTQHLPFSGTPANWPVPAITERTDANGVRFLSVTVDLRGFTGEDYFYRVAAAWAYPSPRNWSLKAYSVKATGFNVFDTADVFEGDWRLWLNVPNASNVTDGIEWLKLLDCNDCVDTGMHTASSWSRDLTDADGRIREPVRLFPGEAMELRTIGYDSDTIWDTDIGGIDERWTYEELGDRVIDESVRSSTGYYSFNYQIAPAAPVGLATLSAGALHLFDAYSGLAVRPPPGGLQGPLAGRAKVTTASAPAAGPVKASSLPNLRFTGTNERNLFTITDAERAHALATPAARATVEQELRTLRQRVCTLLGSAHMRQKTMSELAKVKGGFPTDMWQRVFGDLERGGSCAPVAPRTARPPPVMLK